MDGSLKSCDEWFNSPSNTNSSAHIGISLNGEKHRYVRSNDRSWSNGVLESGNRWITNLNPNHATIAIETEDMGIGNTPVFTTQYESTLQQCREEMAKYPSIKWLLRHSDISPLSKPNCPGARWAVKFKELAIELGLNYF